MTLFVLAYVAGLLTIATPCIFPVLPFVLARSGTPFRRGGLPLLLGLALSFAAVASLAAVAGGWAVAANRYGRIAALLLMFLFGLAMLSPALSARLAAPLVALGARLSQRTGRGAGIGTSLLLGLATGLVWAPCAGPVLGLILTGAALRGPSVETSLLLFTYGLGAATALAAGLLFGRRLLAWVRPAWDEGLRRVLGVGVAAAALSIGLGLDSAWLDRTSAGGIGRLEQHLLAFSGVAHAAEKAPMPVAVPELSEPLQALVDAPQWLNTPPLRADDLRGKVVLVDFWTYSCINCLRTLPYLRAWADRYRDRGLVVVGVHTPEFAFEKNVANVQRALAAQDVRYPVAIDSDFRIWRAFDNHAWPAFYFIGADGRIRQRVLGEGGYEQSERLIRQLLAEAGPAPATTPPTAAIGDGAQAAADIAHLRSGETYIGYEQASNCASPGGFAEDAPSLYRNPAALPLNRWSLAGTWTVGGEYAVLDGSHGSISYRFHARDLHLVLAPPAAGGAARFRVLIDGAAPGASHGADIDADGWGQVREARLYQLVRQDGQVTEHTFEIEFLDPGVRAYSFTFG